jgi:hypothetical protein
VQNESDKKELCTGCRIYFGGVDMRKEWGHNGRNKEFTQHQLEVGGHREPMKRWKDRTENRKSNEMGELQPPHRASAAGVRN